MTLCGIKWKASPFKKKYPNYDDKCHAPGIGTMYQCKEEFGGVADFSSFTVHRTVRMVVMVVFLFQKVIIIIHSIFLASTSPCLASKLLRSSSIAAQSWKETLDQDRETRRTLWAPWYSFVVWSRG